jgi:WD40 repeat protein
MQRVRVFVSSPGDVGREREVAARVIARISAEFAGRLIVEPYFWEHEPMHAGADFQGQIPPPARFQIFIGILWSRLGSRLHSQHARSDGSHYRSGTEFEFETALEAYRQSERHTPRILIYRRTEVPSFPAEPPNLRHEREAQWEALKSFVEHWFNDVTDGGTFKAAFNAYANTAEFEERLENHLRKLLVEFAGETAPASEAESATAIWTQGSPYRGLKTFEFEHAPVFFGRTRSIDQVIGQLLERAREGSPPFLLIFGSSGSGKSSLLRAGLLPAIINGAVDGIGLWRRAVMQPSQTAGDLFDGLASALAQPAAVPELLVGGTTLAALAEMLRINARGVGMLLRGALPQIAQSMHQAERQRLNTLAATCRSEGRIADAEYAEQLAGELRYPEPLLVIALDQLEEIFTHEERFPAANRTAFFRAVSSLLDSHFVWVIATLRSDFFARCEELPELVQLKSGKGQFHLLPATATELAQMIRLPAQAAGVRFEDHPVYGRLEDTLRDAAIADTGSLPLLEFALDNLFQLGSNQRVLTFANFKQLSGEGEGLRGILVNVAEEVYGKLSSEARVVFPRVFLSLATIAAIGTDEGNAGRSRYARRVARPTPPLPPGEREIYDVFVQARLLVADADAQGHQLISVAHEALLNEWPRLRDLLESEVRILRMRSRVSTAAAQWSQEGRKAIRLATGVTLAEGREVVARGMQLDPDERDFVRLSVQRSRRRYIAAGIAAASLIVLFATLAWQASRSRSETQRVLALSDLARAEELLDQNESDSALAYLARAAQSSTAVAKPAAERLWFALTERTWPLAISNVMRHRDTILSATMSADGKLIATGSKDLTACVWDAETGKLIAATPKLPKPVRVVCFKPHDNAALLTGCVDGTLTLWRWEEGKIAPMWTAAHPDEVASAAFSSTGQFVATGCRDGNTRVWLGENGNQVCEFPGRKNVNVHTLLFSPNNDDLFLILSANTARLLQISQRKEVHTWTHKGDVNEAAFTPAGNLVATAGAAPLSYDGKMLATAANAPAVQIWSVVNGEPVGKPIVHDDDVTSVRFAPDNQLLTTISGNQVFVWKIDGSPALERPLATGGSVSKVTFSIDGLRIYTGTNDSKVQTWSALDGTSIGEPVRERAQIIALLPLPDNLHLIVGTQEGTARNWLMPTLLPTSFQLNHPRPVEMMSATAEGETIVTACQDGKARMWKINGKLNEPIVIDDSGKVQCVAISANGTYVATGGWDALMRVWRVSDRSLVGGKPIKFDTTVTNLLFSPREDVIAAGSQGGVVRIYRLPDLATPLREQTAHKDGVRALRFDRAGRRLATGWNGGTIEIIEIRDTNSCQVIGTPIVAARDLTALDLNPSGRLLVTGDGDGVVQLWNVDTDHKQGPSASHNAAVQALIFSPDERFFVSSSNDGTAGVWSTDTGEPVSAAFVHRKPVCSLAISRDSRRVATGTEDGTVQMWNVVGQPLSERLTYNDAIRGLFFTSNSANLVSASSDGNVYVTDVAATLSSSDYNSLARFGRSLSSVSLDQSGRLAWRSVPQLDELRALCGENGGVGNFCRWFFTSRTRRTLTPFAKTTVAEQAVNMAIQLQANSLKRALLSSAGDPDLSAKVLANQH